MIDKNLKTSFTEKLLNKSIVNQKQLINKAIKVLKKGGELIYSTCSILKEENEFIINDVLKNNSNLEIVRIEFKGLEELPILKTSIVGTICLMPTDEYEGFFVAKIKKKY